MTEQEMRAATVPTFDTEEQLTEYIRNLVGQEHDYGTCAYAMSMAATAAFQFVAKRLNVTGFQASCADLDVLRRTRDLEWGCVQNFKDLLYPQLAHKFPGWDALLQEHRYELGRRARKLLAENLNAAPEVRAHWAVLAEKTGGA